MIKPPSLFKPYTDCVSFDAAFVQLEPTATDEQKADYAARLQVAVDTGDWSGLRVAGAGEPTVFHLRVLTGDAFGKLADMQRAGVGDNELFTLALRLALLSVTGLGDARVSVVDDPKWGRIADLGFLEQAGIVGGFAYALIRELGERVLKRASGLPFASPTA